MGKFLNPAADDFIALVKSGRYVDKSGLIAYTNGVMHSSRRLTCLCRPRGFGKTTTARMLCAYYSRNAETGTVFNSLAIARITHSPFQNPTVRSVSPGAYLNQLDVLFISMTEVLAAASSSDQFVETLTRLLVADIQTEWPETAKCPTNSLANFLLTASLLTGRKFFIILDDWDIVFRKAPLNAALHKNYLRLLRRLFKGLMSPRFVAGACLTGILPVKALDTLSGLDDVRESTMLAPSELAPFVGFTDEEVHLLCCNRDVNCTALQQWYGGYFPTQRICNPSAVITTLSAHRPEACRFHAEDEFPLKAWLNLSLDGFQKTVDQLLKGAACRLSSTRLASNWSAPACRDEVLVLLVHFGYLNYDADSQTVRIPNENVRQSFQQAVQ